MMKTPALALRHAVLSLLGCFVLITAMRAQAPASTGPASTAAAPGTTADADHDARMAWFREAKYGLFIHWGLYAIPAGEWKGQRAPGIGEWVMNRMKIPVTEYEKLAGGFNPIRFDAEAWVRMAVDAGMKYIVITSKHHDGFAMYHSAVSPYNVYDATPFHRDPIKELADACARHHMPFGFYYSQSQDWHEPGGMGNNWDFASNPEKSKSGAYDDYIKNKAVPQVKELLSNYGPVCLMWFDTPQEMTRERGQVFIDAVRALQPKTLIDGRLLPNNEGGDYVSTGDNSIPPSKQEKDFEVPATTNHTWGFRKDDTDWKSPGDILFKLVDITSKGGNYLLNVGPTAEGVVPQAAQDNLRTVGRWLKVNGEAVYGAGRSPFGDEFGEYAAKAKDRSGNPMFLARTDWRCTTKPGKLYFTIFHVDRGAPAGGAAQKKANDADANAKKAGATASGNYDAGFVLPAFKNAIKTAYMLDDKQHTPLRIATDKDGNRILVVSRMAINDTMGAVAVVEIEGDAVQL